MLIQMITAAMTEAIVTAQIATRLGSSMSAPRRPTDDALSASPGSEADDNYQTEIRENFHYAASLLSISPSLSSLNLTNLGCRREPSGVTSWNSTSIRRPVTGPPDGVWISI